MIFMNFTKMRESIIKSLQTIDKHGLKTISVVFGWFSVFNFVKDTKLVWFDIFEN